jgi:hypothetical protein
MKYDVAAERELIAARGNNMRKTWSERRMGSDEHGLRPYLFAPERGLKDMLRRHKLRAKEAVAIKDGEEILPTVGLFRARIQERMATPGPEEPYLGALNEMLHQMEQATFRVRTFVACFCKDADGPVLWSRFGQNGLGYMLELRPDPYIRRDVPVDYSYLRGSVTYRDPVKLEQFDKAVDLGASVLQAIEDLVARPLTPDHVNLFTSFVASEVAQEIALMKPEDFEDEREWRFAYSQQDAFPLPVERVPIGTPHVSLPLATGDDRTSGLPIFGVVLGKYAALTEGDVYELLEEHRYKIPRACVRRSVVEPHDPGASA